MVKAVAALIEFCYLVRRSVIDEDTFTKIEAALSRFHQYREAFREFARPEGFSLPRQHSLVHYPFLITQFGALNGLCSSITESKHIKAVKKPYRRSSRNKPLGQMLVTNQRVDKLAAACVFFSIHGMLNGSGLPEGLFGNIGPPATVPSTLREQQEDEPAGSGTGTHDNDAGDVEDPLAIAEVKLAKRYSKFAITLVWLQYSQKSVVSPKYP